MKLSRRLQRDVSRMLISTPLRDRRRKLQRMLRGLRGGGRRVLYFHQVDDPYSHLAAQLLGGLAERYEIQLEIHLVGPPAGAEAPDPERLVSYSRIDAARVAGPWGLNFRDPGSQPSSENLRRASEILASHLEPKIFAEVAPRVGSALWSDNTDEILALSNEFAAASAEKAEAAIAQGNRLRQKLGHYNSATFCFEGEWYWGVDRLHYLEERLRLDGARRDDGKEPLIARREIRGTTRTAGSTRVTLEYFPSLRSPYTAISPSRTYAIAENLPVDFVIKPVLPMVMRGMKVGLAKRMYIVRDTKREADLLGVPFGNLCDPIGRPVERGFSLYPFARSRNRTAEYLRAFLEAAFAEGIDTGTEEGLRHVVEHAGLDWQDARAELDGDTWREELEANRQEMLESGVWGVPSYRVRSEGEPDFVVWGQDRIWLVEEEIVRRIDAEARTIPANAEQSEGKETA